MTDRDQRIAAYDNYAAHAMSALMIANPDVPSKIIADDAALLAQVMMIHRARQIRSDYQEHPPIRLGPR